MKKPVKPAKPAGKKVRAPKDHYIYVKASILPLFEEGKDLEVRVLSQYMRRVRVGDTLRLNDAKNEITRKVVAIREYASLSDALEHEDHKRIYPLAKSKEELLEAFGKLYVASFESHEVRVYELAKL